MSRYTLTRVGELLIRLRENLVPKLQNDPCKINISGDFLICNEQDTQNILLHTQGKYTFTYHGQVFHCEVLHVGIGAGCYKLYLEYHRRQ